MSETAVLRASELVPGIEGVLFRRTFDAYRKELRGYERRRGGREEVERTVKGGEFEILGGTVTRTGFWLHRGQVFVERPRRPERPAYLHHDYAKDLYNAHDVGWLANPRVNRPINPRRVEEYREEMQAGRWRDLLSDPITFTKEGHVVNGQHRLAAASQVDWSKVEGDPLFLLVWGVEPEEALLTDSTRRTGNDQVAIARKMTTQV